MRRPIWLGFVGIVALTSLVVVFTASMYLRIQPLSNAELIQNAKGRRRHAERLREKPSLKNLAAIEPMKVEQVLILEPIGGLAPGKPEGSKPWRPPDIASQFAPEMDFQIEYVAGNNDNPADSKEILVVEVQQFPSEAWPLYFAKWSPNPGLLREENPRLVLTRVEKFGNRIVMDR